jgi:hypothetical protein
LTLGQAGRCGRPVLSLRAAARSKAVRRVAEPVRLQLAAARDADRAVVLLRVASGEVDGLTALRLNGANGAGAPLALRLPNRAADIQVRAADEQKKKAADPVRVGGLCRCAIGAGGDASATFVAQRNRGRSGSRCRPPAKVVSPPLRWPRTRRWPNWIKPALNRTVPCEGGLSDGNKSRRCALARHARGAQLGSYS